MMPVVTTFAIFCLSAAAELLGSWLVWQGVRENRGLVWIGLGVAASGVYPLAATMQEEPEFGRVLAAYGGVFIAVALVWSTVLDGFRPDRFDVLGAAICLLGVATIMFGPRPS
ncbi:YnfA family protein [bacterium]|nr:YnfA family protein [bacterium]